MRPGRIRKAAIVLKPATLTKFRRALLSRVNSTCQCNTLSPLDLHKGSFIQVLGETRTEVAAPVAGAVIVTGRRAKGPRINASEECVNTASNVQKTRHFAEAERLQGVFSYLF